MMRLLILALFLFFPLIGISQNDCANLPETFRDETECEVLWKDWDLSSCIGVRDKLYAHDFDQDEIDELIIGNFNYWQVLKYSAVKDTFEYFYQSEYYKDIRMFKILDFRDDGVMDVVIHHRTNYDYEVQIISLDDFEIIHTIHLPWELELHPKEVVYSNIVPNGDKYLVFSGSNKVFVYDEILGEMISVTSVTSGDFALGNIDSDEQLEIVFDNGDIWEFNEEGELIFQKDLLTETLLLKRFVEFENIDGDPWDEIIFAGFGDIIAINAETEDTIYSIDPDYIAETLEMFDFNNDGTKDIFYGDDQWGGIHIHNGLNGDILWTIENPSHGTDAIVYGNFDDDDSREIFWSGNCFSRERLHLADIQINAIQWSSMDLNGPNYTVEIADLNQDNSNEIITWSASSDDSYGGSVLSIYDQETKELIHRVNFDGLTGNNDFYVWDMHIFDAGNDGDLDIMFFSFGNLHVIDGTTYTIESEIDLDINLSGLAGIEMADLDEDGIEEIVAYAGNTLLIINSIDFTIKNNISFPGSGSFFQPKIKIANLDEDSHLEIVFIREYLLKLDDYNTGYELYVSEDNYYKDFDIVDWTGDGKNEIAAGTDLANIHILSGEDLSLIQFFNIANNDDLTAVFCYDINQDGESELITSVANELHFLSKNGNIIKSQSYGLITGFPNASRIVPDDDPSFPNILLGTKGLIEVSTTCTECLWFDPQFWCENATCGTNNGKIFGMDMDTSTVYYITQLETTFRDSITGLTPNFYDITATNSLGCVREFEIRIKEEILSTLFWPFPANECNALSGALGFFGLQGADPIYCEWTNLDNGIEGLDSIGEQANVIDSLSPGTYAIKITDANHCIFIDTLEILLSTIIIDVVVTQATCPNQSVGIASLISSGSLIEEVYWDGVLGGSDIDTLSEGLHTVEVFDAFGCSKSLNFQVEASFVDFQLLQLPTNCDDPTSGDILLTPNIEARLPYDIVWSHGVIDELYFDDLPLGNYMVTITDACDDTEIESIEVESFEFNVLFEYTDIVCAGDENGTATVSIIAGVFPFSYTWSTGQSTIASNNTSSSIFNLGSGEYTVFVEDGNGCSNLTSFSISNPLMLSTEAIVISDDFSTSIGDGSIEILVSGGVQPYEFNWDFGADSAKISGLLSGEYSVTITDNLGCEIDTTVFVDFINAEDNVVGNNFNLFPNPTYGKVFFNNPFEINKFDIEIFSANGSKISTAKIVFAENNELSYIDMNELSPGIYFIGFLVDGQQNFEKIVLLE